MTAEGKANSQRGTKSLLAWWSEPPPISHTMVAMVCEWFGFRCVGLSINVTKIFTQSGLRL